MDILVCVKQVPDGRDVALDENHSIARERIAQVMNPADESAVELALSLRAAHGGGVWALSMGLGSAEGMLREIASRGADSLCLLNDPAYAGADTLATARTLASAIRLLGHFSLIVCGRRSADGSTGQVGPELAALLGIPVITNATKVSIENGALRALRLVEGGEEELSCSLPALVTVCEWSYPLRLPSLSGLRRAGTAAVRRIPPAQLDLPASLLGLRGSPTRVARVSLASRSRRSPDMCADAERGADLALRRIEALHG